jgi:hypothetical protein
MDVHRTMVLNLDRSFGMKNERKKADVRMFNERFDLSQEIKQILKSIGFITMAWPLALLLLEVFVLMGCINHADRLLDLAMPFAQTFIDDAALFAKALLLLVNARAAYLMITTASPYLPQMIDEVHDDIDF